MEFAWDSRVIVESSEGQTSEGYRRRHGGKVPMPDNEDLIATDLLEFVYDRYA